MAKKNSKEPVSGLFKNGNLFWCRVRGPQSKEVKRRSTGTENPILANSIMAMIGELEQDRTQGWEWLERVVSGEVALMDVYNYRVTSTLHELRSLLDGKQQTAKDEDLREWVNVWLQEVLPKRVTKRGGLLGERQRADYERQLRALIPADVPTRSSELTEEYVTNALARLGASANTQRNYVSAWRLFVRWARRKGAPIPADPFEYASEFVPGPSKPRSKVWSHRERLAVLDELDGPAKAAIALMLGSGMELSALLRLRGKDVSHDGSRTVFADGSKTEYRSRHVTVDAWAWKIFLENVPKAVGSARVFPWSEKTKGAALRESFYRAQVRAGLCEEPPKSEKGYALWDARDDKGRPIVDVHTIHDCRHTFAICRALGLDGEDKQGNEYIANQLGHANEVMATRIYKNLTPARRRQLLAEAEKMRRAV